MSDRIKVQPVTSCPVTATITSSSQDSNLYVTDGVAAHASWKLIICISMVTLIFKVVPLHLQRVSKLATSQRVETKWWTHCSISCNTEISTSCVLSLQSLKLEMCTRESSVLATDSTGYLIHVRNSAIPSCAMRAMATVSLARAVFCQMAVQAMALLVLTTLFLGPAVTEADTSFQYYQFSDSSGSISTLNDARIYIDDLALELTSTASGRATYDYPVRVLSTSPATSISFETTFIFSIEPDNPSSSGAGLTFSISSENTTVGDSGPFLGLTKANPTSSIALPSTKYFAVEFDTHQDPQFQDPNDNHVGVDVNSLISTESKPAQSGSTPITLASGSHIQAYITYNSLSKVLDVSIAPYVNSDYVKPTQSLISLPIDLTTVFTEFMYVGFSAATASGSVKHKIWSWTFKTTTVDGNGQAVASPPDSSSSGQTSSPGPSQNTFSPFGDSGGVKPGTGIQWPFLGLFVVIMGLICS